MKAGLVLVLGGARSGKSAYAERLVTESGLERLYLATAEGRDDEMAERIAYHQARRGEGWRTLEETDGIEKVLVESAREGRGILVDCLTLWLSNVMLSGADVESRCQSLCRTAKALPGLVVFVSNEVGLGLVPDTPLGRKFRDAQGRLNQAVAEAANRVVLVAAGLPLTLKGTP